MFDDNNEHYIITVMIHILQFIYQLRLVNKIILYFL